MANTFKKIQTVTVGSGGATDITFTSIPQSYTDLKIVLSGRSTQGNVYGGGAIQFNADTASNYRWRRLRGDAGTGAAASDNSTSATAITNWDMAGANATASIFGNIEIYIPNYTTANAKSVSVDYVGENNAAESHMGIVAGIWTGTAAITSVKLYSAGGNLAQYTSATLYGVSNVTAAQNAYATGGIITYDDTYVYHTFPWSGTFTPTRSLNVDYLVVAGGGGGGGSQGGGGGAGGLRCTVGATGGGGSLESALSLTATAYTVTVGAGGNGGTSGGSNGSNSVFGSITSTGGGGGGYYGSPNGFAGSSGGSGGGGGNAESGTAGSGGAGTSNQGYAGGAGGTRSGTYPTAGGGGGAGAVGQAGAQSADSADGGNGVTTSISGTSTVYAGGGGGWISNVPYTGAGIGGTGGGGNGGNTSGATAGTVNTGGGGGGINATTGGAGGSGIVIVRYAK